MAVIAPPVSVLPPAAGKAAGKTSGKADATHAAEPHATGTHAVKTDTSSADDTSALPPKEAFGDLLAKQLILGVPAPQTPVEVGAQLDGKSDGAVDKAALDATELAAQLQSTIAAQLLASNAAVAPPPPVVSAAEMVTDGEASQKVGEIIGQQRQVIAVVTPELAAATPELAATKNDTKNNVFSAEMEQASAGRNQVSVEKDRQSTFASELAAAGKAQVATAHELDMVQHVATEKRQPVALVVPTDTQSVPAASAAFTQILSGQQSQGVSQSRSVPGASIQAPVGSSAWGNGLGDKVVWMVGQQQQSVELHLNPPALGPLEVRVSMSDGQANLSFMTQHVPVREAIEGATSRLREMLGDSGISMGSVSVNVGTFAQQQSSAQQDNGRSASGFRQSGNEMDFFSAAPVVTVRSLHVNGMVDTFA